MSIEKSIDGDIWTVVDTTTFENVMTSGELREHHSHLQASPALSGMINDEKLLLPAYEDWEKGISVTVRSEGSGSSSRTGSGISKIVINNVEHINSANYIQGINAVVVSQQSGKVIQTVKFARSKVDTFTKYQFNQYSIYERIIFQIHKR